MEAAKDKVQDIKNTFFSGGPGTTGREVFEDSTATGPGAAYGGTRSGAGAGAGAGTGAGAGGATGGDYSETQTYKNTGGVVGSRPRDEDRSQPLADSSAMGVGAAGVNAFGHNPHNDNVIGSAERNQNQTTAQGQYGSVSPVGGGTGVGGGGGETHHHHRVHHAEQIGAAGVIGAGAAAEEQHHHYHHHGHHGDAGTTFQQDLAVSGRTGPGGPVTGGAPGTDRFDSDRTHAATSTVTGDTTAGGHRVPEGEAGSAPKASGGVAGVLGTSDKDFTERDRKGTGAYADTHGQYQLNTSGPAGNTALTGREGNPDTNPVAQSTGAGTGAAAGAGAGAGATGVDRRESLDSEGKPKKKGFMAKVKEALA